MDSTDSNNSGNIVDSLRIISYNCRGFNDSRLFVVFAVPLRVSVCARALAQRWSGNGHKPPGPKPLTKAP